MKGIRSAFNLFLLLTLATGLLAGAGPASAARPAALPGGDVVISQVYGGGSNSGAPYKSDYVELYNRTGLTVDLSTWAVQYASATGSSWTVNALSGSIAPGRYFLFKLYTGSVGADLPTPDATGTINMSATNGKLALTNTATQLTGSCPTGGAIVDFVGFGTANCYEGTAAAPAPSNTTAIFRAGGGATDTNQNSADFSTGVPYPRNSSYQPDVRLEKTGPAAVLVGKQQLVYNLKIDNTLGVAATNLVLTDTLPISTTYVSDTSGVTPSNPSAGVYVWNFPDLASNSSLNFNLTLDVDTDILPGETLTNTAVISTSVVGDDPLNNEDEVLTEAHEIVPISTARAGANDEYFAIQGFVTVAPLTYSASEWEMQDASGGISVYYSPAPTLALGDEVILLAKRGSYNGQEQMVTPVLYYEKVGSGPEVAPRTDYTTGEVVAGDSEGWLVQVEGTVSGLGSCTGNYTFYVDDGSGQAAIYVDSDTGVNVCNKGVQNGDLVQVVGFSTQYVSNYQIKPRRPADVSAFKPRLDKTAPIMVDPGEKFTYTLSVYNGLGYALTNVVLTDTIPADAQLAAIQDGGVQVGDMVQWTFATLADQASVTVHFEVTATQTADTFIVNDDYAVKADNFGEVIFGEAVSTLVADQMRIHHVQGDGAESPFDGEVITDLFGVVTWVQSKGFYMQDPQPDADADTSEGIYVYTSSAPTAKVGEAVTVTGMVDEYYLMTEITSVTSVVTDTTTEVITPFVLDLPVAVNLEPQESMLVTIPETMTVSQNYFQGRYGQVTLSADGRLYNPLNGSHAVTLEENLRRMLVLDDNSTAQNMTIVPYIGDDNTLRAGDEVANLTGVIDYGLINSSGGYFYRLQPTQAVTFVRKNERTTAPEVLPGSLRVASFNLYNFFNGNGDGTGFPALRGPSTYDEFVRQRDKLIPALVALNGDIVGLMEVENDNAFIATQLIAIQDLVNSLNAVMGAGTYAWVLEPAPGTDQIKVAMIYKPAVVTPQGAGQNFQMDYGAYTDVFNRPPLAQTFKLNSTGDVFTVVVNHFKSKGCGDATGADLDQGDGAGCYAAKRLAQAQAMLLVITQLQTSSGDEDVLVIGDLNAYAEEASIQALITGGLVNLVEDQVDADDRYSYVFDGQAGYLDHMLATELLAIKMLGVDIWHINTDEPEVINYDQDYNPPGYYTADPYRSSDHDPVVGVFGLFAYYLLRILKIFSLAP
ncbi:MAG: ExeM/NucH family extracellular endonuclease [Anaerolineales bacterium]|nr:ExeM/NucH family extracellular endonuclease [Anaerolineales bacterium]